MDYFKAATGIHEQDGAAIEQMGDGRKRVLFVDRYHVACQKKNTVANDSFVTSHYHVLASEKRRTKEKKS